MDEGELSSYASRTDDIKPDICSSNIIFEREMWKNTEIRTVNDNTGHHANKFHVMIPNINSTCNDFDVWENNHKPEENQLGKSDDVRRQCRFCNRLFEMEGLRAHYSEVHPSEQIRFICDDCGKGFKFEGGLSLHKAKHHNAQVSQKTRQSQPKPKLHLEHDGADDFILTCHFCGMVFEHITSFTIHLRGHSFEKILQCRSCEQSFLTDESLREHLQIHQHLQPNQCYKCRQHCDSSDTFTQHMDEHKHEAKFECDCCSLVFWEAEHLAIHLLLHRQDVFHCNTCADTFFTQKIYNEHMEQHGISAGRAGEGKTGKARKVYSCNICDLKFLNVIQLRAHHKTHKSKKEITCAECGEMFSSLYKLRKHETTHKNDKLLKCCVCRIAFAEMDALEIHIVQHDNRTVDCLVCGDTLTGKADILLHLRQHNNEREMEIDETVEIITSGESENEKTSSDALVKMVKTYGRSIKPKRRRRRDRNPERQRFKCNICEKMFHFKSGLDSHMLIHEADQQLKCHICGEVYVGVKPLRVHIGSEHKDSLNQSRVEVSSNGKVVVKRHRCDICLEKFSTYYACKLHRLLHAGEKPFACSTCGQRFVLSSLLKSHELTHLTIKPNVCEVCGKSFNKPYILREHQMSHTGIKPFLCDLCGKTFVNRKKLKLHTFFHTRETPFNCKVCGRGFRASVTRQKHKCAGPPVDKDEANIDNPNKTTTSTQDHEPPQMDTVAFEIPYQRTTNQANDTFPVNSDIHLRQTFGSSQHVNVEYNRIIEEIQKRKDEQLTSPTQSYNIQKEYFPMDMRNYISPVPRYMDSSMSAGGEVPPMSMLLPQTRPMALDSNLGHGYVSDQNTTWNK